MRRIRSAMASSLRRTLSWVFLLELCIVLVILKFLMPSVAISPATMTFQEMDSAAEDLQLSMLLEGETPPILTVEGIASAGPSTRLDHWGRPLLLEFHDQYEFAVVSLGSDGVRGGSGSARDLVARFKMRNDEYMCWPQCTYWSEIDSRSDESSCQ